MRWFAGLSTSAIIALTAWVFTTNATVAVNSKTLEQRKRSVDAVPEIRTDVEVIKNEQRHLRDDVNSVKQDTKAILRELRQRPSQ